MRALLVAAVLLAGCQERRIATRAQTVTLKELEIKGALPSAWRLDDSGKSTISWVVDDVARLDLSLMPCAGLPCHGPEFGAELTRQLEARGRAKTIAEPLVEVRPGVWRVVYRRPARKGAGDEVEVDVFYTGEGWSSVVNCGGFVRGIWLPAAKELVNICLGLRVSRTD